MTGFSIWVYILLLVTLVSPGRATLNWNVITTGRKEFLESELRNKNLEFELVDQEAKYAKMGECVFCYFRGTAHIFYADLGVHMKSSSFYNSSARTFILGDSHSENIGSFDDDEGNIVYDLNDFDEAWIANFLFDIIRFSVSIALIGQELGFLTNEVEGFIDVFLENYMDVIQDIINGVQTQLPSGEHVDWLDVVWDKTAFAGNEELDDFLKSLESSTQEGMLNDWSEPIDGTRRFLVDTNDKLEAISGELYAAIETAIENYVNGLNPSNFQNDKQIHFAIQDIARRRGAGIGSLGVERYYVLIEGDSSAQEDDRLLDLKLQSKPSLFPYLDSSDQDLFNDISDATRVVLAHRSLLKNADDYLGNTTIFDKSFSIRERSRFKETYDYTDIGSSSSKMNELCQRWAQILATAHVRSDPHASSLGYAQVANNLFDTKHQELRDELRPFTLQYSGQIVNDYSHFLELFSSGVLTIPISTSSPTPGPVSTSSTVAYSSASFLLVLSISCLY